MSNWDEFGPSVPLDASLYTQASGSGSLAECAFGTASSPETARDDFNVRFEGSNLQTHSQIPVSRQQLVDTADEASWPSESLRPLKGAGSATFPVPVRTSASESENVKRLLNNRSCNVCRRDKQRCRTSKPGSTACDRCTSRGSEYECQFPSAQFKSVGPDVGSTSESTTEVPKCYSWVKSTGIADPKHQKHKRAQKACTPCHRVKERCVTTVEGSSICDRCSRKGWTTQCTFGPDEEKEPPQSLVWHHTNLSDLDPTAAQALSFGDAPKFRRFVAEEADDEQ